MAKQQINPRNAIMFLLQREYFRECERGETTKDGFEVSDTDYVVEEKNGSVYRMIEAEFLAEYE